MLYGVEPPPVPAEVEHLCAFFAELGCVERTGMGVAPLSHREVRAWAELRRFEPSAREARALRMMSQAYANTANTPDAPWPIEDEDDAVREQIDRVRIGALIASAG